MFKRISCILFFVPLLMVSQHTIRGTFTPGEEYQFAILYKVTPEASMFVANTMIDDAGKFEFQLDSTVTEGMYKLVYALPQSEFNFDVIYNAKEDVELDFNAETGVEFKTSVENKLVNSYTNSMGLISQSVGNFYRQQSTDSLALKEIFKTQEETQTEYEKAAEGTIALNFIQANRPYIPENFEDIVTYIENLKLHFFDHVDFNNKVLQSSNFLIERVLNYIFGMGTKEGDEIASFKQNIDEVCNAMQDAAPEIKSILLEVLWQQMVDGNQEEVANYITENYLLSIAESLDDQELIDGLTLFKDLSIGNKAPEFDVRLEEDGEVTNISLYDYKVARQYVIVFWSSGCSHCLDEIPQLHEFVKDNEDIKVIAIGLEDEPSKWQIEVAKYPEFDHILALGKWQNEIGRSYNVTSTPTYFVLNDDKKILAKPYDFAAYKKWTENNK
jgi:thiol-disulfide isomerase/thioredoxin